MSRKNKGHIVADQEENIKEEKEDVKLKEKEKESIGEVFEHADEGELLVVRTALISF